MIANVLALTATGLGALLILLGAWMSYSDWKRNAEPKTDKHFDKTLSALAKLCTAISGYPPGQKLIVFGIVLLLIGGVVGGVKGLV
jgi:hypothetical protein